MSKHRVFIIDDHSMFRAGLVRIIRDESDMIVCAEADTARQALQRIPVCKPELAIIDISLPDIDGLRLVRIIRKKYPSLRILVLSMHDEYLYAGKAIECGANGYLMKEETAEKFLEVVRTILKGENWVNKRVKEDALTRLPATKFINKKSPVDVLSGRERQVFRLLGLGYNNEKIAAELKVKKKTVETHRLRIRTKLGIFSAPRLILAASEWVRKEGTGVPFLP